METKLCREDIKLPYRWMPSILMPILSVLLLLASPASAHEFWIEADSYQVEPDQAIVGHTKTGMNFKGIRDYYLPHLFDRFEMIDADGMRPVEGLPGDIPPLNMMPRRDGLHRVIYQSKTKTVHFEEWQKFADYLLDMGLEPPLARHTELGYAPNDVTESYIRCAKALVAVGDGAGQDASAGMPIELVALNNPYTTADATGLTVQLLWQNAPMGNAQITVFHGQNETLQVVKVHTNDTGIAVLPNLGPGPYLANAVHFMEAPSIYGTPWLSHWASLTYKQP
ncbi:MAG: DUF4198 domain-containing protein [Alphaproteobacteria bacterium]|nr:DUF4198 domain-containing protein [Alphaproteobacteria bacterium]